MVQNGLKNNIATLTPLSSIQVWHIGTLAPDSTMAPTLSPFAVSSPPPIHALPRQHPFSPPQSPNSH
ncbi:hypothetical protein E2C01_062731 [Portunus trituberculatus]|uniref:Uncharacterized protein n=1 Tax=Portunus trituberculatus TaxID=210409 RepID=A0A5B7HFH9_PORTR|nr:hypothetical protein [Portunus trituberculatus]